MLGDCLWSSRSFLVFICFDPLKRHSTRRRSHLSTLLRNWTRLPSSYWVSLVTFIFVMHFCLFRPQTIEIGLLDSSGLSVFFSD